MDLVIEADGTVRFVYSDALAEVFAGEQLETTRASHVEPHPAGGWYADMAPVGGPVLGDGTISVTIGAARPFATRQAALDAERAWLREFRGL